MPTRGGINNSEKEIKDKIETIKSIMISRFCQVKIINLTQDYSHRDVDEIFVDLKCEPYRFSLDNKDNSENDKPCLDCINYDAIESASFKHVVILGLPGAGKTTLLKKLFKEYSKHVTVIPIYVELKQEEKRGRFSTLWGCGNEVRTRDVNSYLFRYFEPLGVCINDEFIEFLNDNKYKIIFFCDGLDEITQEQYHAYTSTVQSLSYYDSYRFVISSRHVGFQKSDYSDDKFALYSLMDFDETKQKKYIRKYFRTVSAATLDGETKSDRESKLISLLNTPTIQRMAKSPVLLSLLCVMPSTSDINNKAQLFKKAIEVLLNGRYNLRNRDLQIYQQYLIDFLKRVAVVFFKLDKAENFDVSELRFYAEKIFPNHDPVARMWLLDNYLSCGLFDKIDDGTRDSTYKFAHRTIWEYLVADGMSDDSIDKNEIYNRANMNMWEEPIKMWVPLVVENRPQQKRIIFEELWKRNKSLTLNCLSELVPFPNDIFSELYGSLSKRDKLRLIATLRENYENPSSDYRKQAINTIKETLTLIHNVERDCEVVYSYITFLEEYSTEREFLILLNEFMDYNHLEERLSVLHKMGLEFVRIPSGTFVMGRDKNDDDEQTDKKLLIVDEEESPAHKVRIASSFEMSKSLITNQMYYDSGFPYVFKKNDVAVYKSNPYSKSDLQPVNYVTWYEAMMFAKWIGCTLPTEAEWEYACRNAGNDDESMSNEIDTLEQYLNEKACYASTSSNRTRIIEIGYNKYENQIGLIDMLGNLREWCLDWYGDDFYKKCCCDFYETFNTDIKDKRSITYCFDVNNNPIIIKDKRAVNTDCFTFDELGYCVDPCKTFVGDFESKSLRGGCFDWSVSNLRPTYRNHNPAINIYKVNGFRVVKKNKY